MAGSWPGSVQDAEIRARRGVKRALVSGRRHAPGAPAGILRAGCGHTPEPDRTRRPAGLLARRRRWPVLRFARSFTLDFLHAPASEPSGISPERRITLLDSRLKSSVELLARGAVACRGMADAGRCVAAWPVLVRGLSKLASTNTHYNMWYGLASVPYYMW